MKTETTERKCKERVAEHFKSRIDDLTKLWAAECAGNEKEVENLGTFNEYGLSFDYVAPHTWKDQEEGYFRYQISWGGPSDEFRFYTGPEFVPYRIEYWFLDWYDGAKINLSGKLYGKEKKLMLEIFQYFKECETVQYVYNEAQS